MRRRAVQRTQGLLLLVIGLTILAGILSAWRLARAGDNPSWLSALLGSSGWRIGIVAGHHGNDSGAVCPDGLTEAEINLQVAERVAEQLRALGATPQVLEEYDPRLRGYRADALVAIHVDSCAVDLTGFKVASLSGGSQEAERLATCLWDNYEATTGLPRHPDTITDDMRYYHVFRQISSYTPAAIIELGFLSGDRAFLTEQPDRAAAGIVAGLRCFLETPEP